MRFDIRAGLLHGWAGFSVLPETRSVNERIVQELCRPDPR